MKAIFFFVISSLLPLFSSASVAPGQQHQCDATRDRFNRDGYAVLRNFFPEANNDLLSKEWFGFSTNYWNRIFEVLHEQGHISEPRHVMNDEYVKGKLRQPGYKEIVHRNPGRYELSLSYIMEDGRKSVLNDNLAMPPLQPIIDKLEPIILSILQQHPNYKVVETEGSSSESTRDTPKSNPLKKMIQKLFKRRKHTDNNNDDVTNPQNEGSNTKKYNLIHSMLISAPGSLAQQFHFDTRHLPGEGEKEHYPAHIINVFIPLVNITSQDFGPTELIPQSHVETRLLQNAATRSQAKQLRTPIAPLMDVGDVLMFDFRILHRGLPNMRNVNRPMLVLAFSIPSFHDTANWPGPSIFEEKKTEAAQSS